VQIYRSLSGAMREHSGDVLNDREKIGRLNVDVRRSGFKPDEIGQRRNQRAELVDRLVNVLKLIGGSIREGPLEQVDVAVDDRQRTPEIVRHPGQHGRAPLLLPGNSLMRHLRLLTRTFFRPPGLLRDRPADLGALRDLAKGFFAASLLRQIDRYASKSGRTFGCEHRVDRKGNAPENAVYLKSENPTGRLLLRKHPPLEPADRADVGRPVDQVVEVGANPGGGVSIRPWTRQAYDLKIGRLLKEQHLRDAGVGLLVREFRLPGLCRPDSKELGTG
jgi:hypothetical protein